MRLAFISDIHANFEALEAVLSHIEKQNIDQIHCLGDVIGYGSDPVACVETVDSTCKIKLIGNHEFAALGLVATNSMNPAARHSIEWTGQQLSDRELSIIADYAMDDLVEGLKLVHSSPFEPDEWHYVLTEDEADMGFEHLKEQIAFIGHTHVPSSP